MQCHAADKLHFTEQHAVQSTQYLHADCLQPLDAFIKAWMLPSRLCLPPPQNFDSAAEKVPDVVCAVLGCHVGAHIACNKGCCKVQLQGGQAGLVVLMTVTKEQVDVLEDIFPGPGLVSRGLPVQLNGICTPAVQLCHLLLQDGSCGQVLLVIGKQPMLSVEVCWQLTLRQCCWEGCRHLNVKWDCAGLRACCCDV